MADPSRCIDALSLGWWVVPLLACGASDVSPAEEVEDAAEIAPADAGEPTRPEPDTEPADIGPDPVADVDSGATDTSPEVAVGCVATAEASCPLAPPECDQSGGQGAPLAGHLIAADGASLRLADADTWEVQRARVLELAGEATITPVSLAEVLTDLNRSGERVTSVPEVECFHVGFRWNAGDSAVDYWYPQGISGSAAASAEGTVDGRRVLLVSWYHKPDAEGVPDDKGVRIAVVDVTYMAEVRYRFALLVEPVMRDGRVDIAPVRVHAGGLAWVGDLLYVPDTRHGFRVFALDSLLRVDGSDNALIGRQSDGFHAHGYRYVMAQIGHYRLCDGGCCARFSYAALDHSTDPPSILSGEYSAGARHGRIHRWDLASDSGRLVTDAAGVAVASQLLFAGDSKVQGALSWQGRFFLSESGSLHPLRIGEAGAILETRGWVYGAEDLHYSPRSDNLWSHSEHPGSRFVFAVKRERVLAGCQ